MRKVKLNKLQATGTTTGDVYFPQTKVLLPFDGANGATTTSDLSNENHTVSFFGTSQISTVQSKFGGSSLLLDGNSDYLTIPNSSALTLGSGDFTVEAWVYLTNDPTHAPIAVLYDSTANRRSWWFALTTSSFLRLRVHLDETGNASNVMSFNGATTVTENVWHHAALTRNGNTVKLWLDGVQDGSGTCSFSVYNNTTDPLQIGTYFANGSPSAFFPGYIEDLRVTKGVARYTSTFTPPVAHLTSAGDVNKQILINSTADGVAIGTGGINQARIAKAWVNFDGSGTPSIRGSYNVSSITDDAVGYWYVNFSTNMSDANYSIGGNAGAEVTQQSVNTQAYSKQTHRFRCAHFENQVAVDATIMDYIVFGN